MVGQTLKVKGKPYPYYRCRFARDKLSGQRCAGRYGAPGKRSRHGPTVRSR
jgi:hypothetical protein